MENNMQREGEVEKEQRPQTKDLHKAGAFSSMLC